MAAGLAPNNIRALPTGVHTEDLDPMKPGVDQQFWYTVLGLGLAVGAFFAAWGLHGSASSTYRIDNQWSALTGLFIYRALARERIGGLQGLAAEAPKARVTILGHRWDIVCHDLRRFLARNQITFDWITPDDPQLPARWPAPRPADEALPALLLANGTTLVRPQPREVARILGLQTSGRSAEYDTIIVGGGPAGLAAAVYGASEGLRTLVVEREAPGGQAGTSSRILFC